jgi:hypothetical protein
MKYHYDLNKILMNSNNYMILLFEFVHLKEFVRVHIQYLIDYKDLIIEQNHIQ